MKVDLGHIMERINIEANFCIPPRHIPLVPTDMADHKCWLEEVYKGVLRETAWGTPEEDMPQPEPKNHFAPADEEVP